jgi:hypothetical protein
LPAVLRDHPNLAAIGRITLLQSLRCVRLALWDEEERRLISEIISGSAHRQKWFIHALDNMRPSCTASLPFAISTILRAASGSVKGRRSTNFRLPLDLEQKDAANAAACHPTIGQ